MIPEKTFCVLTMTLIRGCYWMLLYFVVADCAPSRRGYGRGTPAKSKTTSCGLAKLQAGDNLKEFTSPGYPGVFSEQTQCSWRIEAPIGSRIKLKIKDFFLLNQHVCGIQYVEFRDHFSGQHYGPLCGRRQPEDLVSAGNSVTIRLESDTVGLSKKYRGFKIFYMKTYDPPTMQMRDSYGKWKNYHTPATTTTLAPPIEPTDNIVDENDNESINRKNLIKNEENRKKAEKFTTERITTVTTETQPQKIQPTMKTTTHPGLWLHPNRNPALLPTRRPPIRQPTHRTPQSEEDNENTAAKAGKYLAIILAFMIVAGIIFFFIYKRRKKKTGKDNKTEKLPCSINTITNKELEPEILPPKRYRCHNYEMVTPLGKKPSIDEEENLKQKPADNNNSKSEFKKESKPNTKEEKSGKTDRRKSSKSNRSESNRYKCSTERKIHKHKTETNNSTSKHYRRERPGAKRDKTRKPERKTSRERKHASDVKKEKNSSSDAVKNSRNIHRSRKPRKPENDHHKSSKSSASRPRSKDVLKKRSGHRKEDNTKKRNGPENTKRHSKPRRSAQHKTKRRHHRRE